MGGDLLPDDHHVSRYCSPTKFDKNSGEPKIGAFQRQWKKKLNRKEDYLSVNWLEYFQEDSLETAVDHVRATFVSKKYELKTDGRFVALSIGEAKAAAEAVGSELSFNYKPKLDDESHSALWGLPEDDLDVATELKLLVMPSDIFPAIV